MYFFFFFEKLTNDKQMKIRRHITINLFSSWQNFFGL